jgi:hypothetical protein
MFLEMHFSAHRGTGQHALINMCAPTLADTWSRRKPGLMTELILKRNRPNPTALAEVPILGADNPAGLSRAEFRVCLLLSAGLSDQARLQPVGHLRVDAQDPSEKHLRQDRHLQPIGVALRSPVLETRQSLRVARNCLRR